MNRKHVLGRGLAMLTAGLMIFSIATAVPAAAKGKKVKKVDLNGVYHATLGIQTCTQKWVTRMGYYAKDQNEVYGTENESSMYYKDSATNERMILPGTFEDVEIAGNGIYTVSLENADFSGDTDISQLHIATDIPLNDTIQFSAVSARVNGREIASFDEGFMEYEEPYLTGGMVCLVMNHWRAELVSALQEKGLSETAESGYSLLKGDGEDSVSITFTVSGFDYDNEQAAGGMQEEIEGEKLTDTSDAGAFESFSDPASKSTEDTSFAGPAIAIVIVLVVIIFIAITGKSRTKKEE